MNKPVGYLSHFLSVPAVAVVAIGLLAGAARAEDRWMSVPDPAPMPAADNSGYAPVDGIKMYYAIYGSGAPILMIHGGVSWGDYWSSEVADLMKDHRVIVADSRGHGRSTRDSQTFSYDLLTDDYVALLDYLKIDRTAIVGWSDGGIIGIDMAMRYPQRLTKVFAQAANVTLDGILPTAFDGPVVNEALAKAQLTYLKVSPTPDQFDDFMAKVGVMWSSEPNWTDAQLGKITTPVAVVVGDHDELIARPHTDHMAKVIPGAVEIILKDVSHFAAIQDPAGYVAAVRGFLDK